MTRQHVQFKCVNRDGPIYTLPIATITGICYAGKSLTIYQGSGESAGDVWSVAPESIPDVVNTLMAAAWPNVTRLDNKGCAL